VTMTSCMAGTYFGVFLSCVEICAEEEGDDALVSSSTMLRLRKRVQHLRTITS